MRLNAIDRTIRFRFMPCWLLLLAGILMSTTAAADPEVTEPSAGSSLSGTTQTFTWSADGVDVERWWLYVGTSPGASNIANSGDLGTDTSYEVAGIPVDGSPVHARLWYYSSAQWRAIDSRYTAAVGDDVALPALLAPLDGSVFTSSSVDFEWRDNNTPVNYWWLYVGSRPGGLDLYNSGANLRTRTAVSVARLPVDGSMVYVRLWYRTTGRGWRYVDSAYRSRDDSPVDPGDDPGDDDGNDGSDDSELVLGKDATAPSSSWTRPVLGTRYDDPAYDTTTRRVTDASGTRFDRNTYSRRQAENADGTLLLTYHGSGRYHVYDRDSLALVRALDIHPDSEPQWHPDNPASIRHVRGPNAAVGDLRYYETNVRTGITSVIADLSEAIRQTIPGARYMKDRAEGSPSADGNRHAWIVHDERESALGIVSYDLSSNRLLGSMPLRTDQGVLDWVSMSPSGNHVVAGYVDGTLVYDADLRNEQRINSKADHSDIALDGNGDDAYVYIDFSAGNDGGWLMSVNLDTLVRTRLIDVYDGANTSIHISGKGYDKPGWVIVSTYNCRVAGAWSCDKVFAVELKADPVIVNLAHTYNCGDNYWTETHAVVNRSFTRVYYNSDAGRCTTEAEVYELELPSLP